MEIIDVSIYGLKVSLILAVFYLVYHFTMHKRTTYAWNRAYLLGTLLLALVIPSVEMPMPDQTTIVSDNEVLHWVTESEWVIEKIGSSAMDDRNNFPWAQLIGWIYLVVGGLFLLRLVFHLVVFYRVKKKSAYVKKREVKLYKTAHQRPFSFLSNVFIPGQLFGTDAFEKVLAHECAHVRQLHSLDRLLMDFYVALFWFNPFIYLYRRALIEIHEFQADEAVIRKLRDPIGYQEVLFAQLSSPAYSGLVSHFNFSTIKKRIVMMNKSNKKQSGWYYLIALPVVLSVIFAFSSKEVKRNLNWIEGEISVMMEPEIPNFDVPDQTPSISPVRKEDLTRLSSGYGMRMDPILKVKRFHHGTDFAAPLGTPVLATADGKVIEVKAYPGGYGKRVVIQHGVFVTRYAQLSEFKVSEGQVVKKGDVIALVGSSGRSTAPHLHYEVLKDGEFVNPIDYIKDYQVKMKQDKDKQKEKDKQKDKDKIK